MKDKARSHIEEILAGAKSGSLDVFLMVDGKKIIGVPLAIDATIGTVKLLISDAEMISPGSVKSVQFDQIDTIKLISAAD